MSNKKHSSISFEWSKERKNITFFFTLRALIILTVVFLGLGVLLLSLGWIVLGWVLTYSSIPFGVMLLLCLSKLVVR